MKKKLKRPVGFSGGNGYPILMLEPGDSITVAPANNLPQGGYWIDHIHKDLSERDQGIFDSLVDCVGLHVTDEEVE